MERPLFAQFNNNFEIFKCPELGPDIFTWDPSYEAARQNCHFDVKDIPAPEDVKEQGAKAIIEYARRRRWLGAEGLDLPPFPCSKCGGTTYALFSHTTMWRRAVVNRDDNEYAGMLLDDVEGVMSCASPQYDDVRKDDGLTLECLGCGRVWELDTVRSRGNSDHEDWIADLVEGADLVGIDIGHPSQRPITQGEPNGKA